jgi:hypothetical protein
VRNVHVRTACETYTDFVHLPLDITTSLAQALRRLRLSDEPRLLWADGLSIAQHDPDEKNQQVQRMGDIFAKADRVLVWLGQDTQGASVKEAMAVVRYIQSRVSNPDREAEPEREFYVLSLDSLDYHMQERGVDDAWTALSAVFDQPWWQRIWCVQESVLARDTLIICGDEEIKGEAIAAFTRWHHEQLWLGYADPSGFDDMGVRSAYRRLNKFTWEGAFLQIIDTFRGLEATNPRDKIYGLLGILQLNKEIDLRIVVDYRQSVSGVLRDVIHHSMHPGKSLRFLSYVDTRAEPGDLPSWIPRWDKTREPWQDHLWCESSTLSACAARTLDPLPDVYALRLQLHGVEFDTLMWTSRILWSDEISMFVQKHLHQSLKFEEGSDEYEAALTRLATTLSGGYIKTNGWAETCEYMDRLDTPTGRKFMFDFVAYVALQIMDPRMHATFSEAVMERMENVPQTGAEVRDCASSYEELMKLHYRGRVLFETARGYIGLGPRGAEQGDRVVVLDGGKVPYVLTLKEEEDEHAFVGECYVMDIMDGQVYDMLGRDGVEEKDFVLQ